MRICLRKKGNKPGPKCAKDSAAADLAAKAGRAADEGDVADKIKINKVQKAI